MAGAFTLNKPGGFSGPNLTVTATDSDGNTSEFSIPVAIITRTPTVTPTPTQTPTATASPTSTATPVLVPWSYLPSVWR